MDKEYRMLNAIEENPNITQRQLATKAQLSLGSINLLINKMVKEGLIKVNQIPMNRVAYMLTPKGITEKINKTGTYIKYHYNYINETKQKIHKALLELVREQQEIYIVLENDEISELIKIAIYDIKGIHYIERHTMEAKHLDELIVVLNIETYELLKAYNNVVNLLELI